MKTRSTLLLLLFFLFGAESIAQKITEKPKLVVGIVVDQMKQEYLLRYYNKFGEGGFKRLVENGFMARNGHYNYVPTSTGPGHASVYTGTTPSNHGIVNNSWYSPVLHRNVYCAEDTTVIGVGGTESSGKISPMNLYSTTITDELKLFTEKKGKVISMSIKDRGSALPGGRYSDGSYWYDSKTGNFMTSTFYMDKLPSWVTTFNEAKHYNRYLSKPWTTLLPIERYTESGPDDSPYEQRILKKESPVFPYDFSNADKKSAILSSPFGNSILADLALASIDAEGLGKDDIPDFLAVSFSSTDYMGHAFGPHAIEVEDAYLRLDLDLKRMFEALDAKVGKGKYVVFLTADHAVAENSKRMHDDRFQTNNISYRNLVAAVDSTLKARFGDEEWMEGFMVLNRKLVSEKGLNREALQRVMAEAANEYPGVYHAYTAHDLATQEYTQGMAELIQNGYHIKESPDLLVVLDPGWQGGGAQGTSHGSGWNYDTHVPILFYGWGVKHGNSVRYMTITDIAPTISMLLNMRMPNAATGQPIEELFKY